VQGAGCRVQGLECRVRRAACSVWGPRLKIRRAAFRAQGRVEDGGRV
jgi:hypothetical protein